MKTTLSLFVVLLLTLGVPGQGRAQISVGLTGVGPLGFETAPPVGEWSTRSVLPLSAASVINGVQLDAVVQTNAAANISTVLPATITIPPSVSGSALWNSTGHYLQTRPTGNTCTLLQARLRNDTGGNVSQLTVSYTLGALVAAGSTIVEEVPGHRVYFSLTGETGTWVPIPEFDSATPSSAGPRSAVLNLGNWAPVGLLFLLWADDNGSAGSTGPNAEGGHTIDDLAVTATISTAPPQIIASPSSQSVAPGSSISFTVTASGATPFFYQWRRNSNDLAGATNQMLTLTNAQETEAGFYSVVVSNSFGTATSAEALLTVACGGPAAITLQPTNQSLASGATLTLTAAAMGTPTLGYQWYRGEVPIPLATNQNYTKPGVTMEDSGLYHLVVSNCAGLLPSADAYVGVAEPSFALVGLTNHFWKYNQSGNDLGTAWREVNYNDAAWASGRGLFAQEDVTAITLLTNTVLSLTNLAGRMITYYFRTHFTLTNELNLITLVSSNYFDDGAVVYVNGAEVFRYNMPAGPVVSTTFAMAAASEGISIVSNLPPGLFIIGDNVIAVEVHQVNLTSTDVVFGLQLNAVPQPPTPLVITNQPADLTILNGQPATFRVGVAGNGARYQWFKDGVPISGATRPSLTLENALVPDAGLYSVQVSNALNTLGSRLATLTVLMDAVAPRLLSAEALDDTHILVRFSEPLSPASVTNLTHYGITNTLGSVRTILAAALTNQTNVLLTMTTLVPGLNYILTSQGVTDASPQQNPAARTALPVVRTVRLIAFDSPWFYFDPVPPFDDPDPGPNWREPVYDTSFWGFDPGAFSFSSDGAFVPPVPVNTSLYQTPVFTTYFRNTFFSSFSRAGLALNLNYAVDDGAAFYLNGTEMHRFNLPSGPLSPETPAATAVDSATLQPGLELPATSLRTGSNLLAVELHQIVAVDADKFFGLELVARVESWLTGPLLVLGGPENTTVTEHQPVQFQVRSVAAEHFQWQMNGTNLPGATNPVLTLASVPLFYDGALIRLWSSNSTQSVVSTNAMLRVLPDTTAPVLLSAVLSGDGTCLLSFSEPLNALTATNPANYILTNSMGTAAVITQATLSNGTNVLLTFENPEAGHWVVIVRDVRDQNSLGNFLSPNPSGYQLPVDLSIPIDAVWRYQQTGGDLGTAWKEIFYDDAASTWASGAALLYVESAALPAPKNTLLSLVGTNVNGIGTITYYFRHAFRSLFVASNAVFQLRHVIDDGAVFYWNGVEVSRFNMAAGAVGYLTPADVSVGDAVYQGPFTFTQNLLGGTNVLAVEVHQINGTGADVVFGAELELHIPGSPILIAVDPAPPRLTLTPSGQQYVLTWSGAGFVLEGAGFIAGPWTVAGTNSPFFVSPTNAAAFYRLRQ